MGLQSGDADGSPGSGNDQRSRRPTAAPGLKYTSLLPSKFSGKPGQDPENHWAAYVDFLHVQGIQENDQEAIYRFRFTLDDRAGKWYRNKTFSTLADLETKFVRYFTNSHSREADSALFDSITRRQNETLEELYGRLKSVADRLNYPDQVVQDKFLRQLPIQLQIGLKTLLRGDPDIDLVEEAQSMWHLSQPGVNDAQVENINLASGATEQDSKVMASLDKMANQMQSLYGLMANLPASHPPSSYNPRGRGRGRGRGGRSNQNPGRFNPYPHNQGGHQGQTSHFEAGQGQASYRGNQSRGRGRGWPNGNTRQNKHFPHIQCHACSNFGHYWRDCPVLKATYSKAKQEQDSSNIPPPPQFQNFQ
jgi:hypothetical protein